MLEYRNKKEPRDAGKGKLTLTMGLELEHCMLKNHIYKLWWLNKKSILNGNIYFEGDCTPASRAY